MAEASQAVYLPTCWTHPFVLPPLTIGLFAVITVVVAYHFPWTVAIGCAAITFLVGASYFSLVVILRYLGHVATRDLKRNARVSVLPSSPATPATPSSPDLENSAKVSPCEEYQVDILEMQGGSAIGLAAAPGRKKSGEHRNLEMDIARIREVYKFDAVVTLLSSEELDLMSCGHMSEVVADNGMDWIHFPVRDKWIPSDTKLFLSTAVRPVVAWLLDGKRVLIHCNGGKGRSGTLAAALLMTSSLRSNNAEASMDIRQAISTMRQSRPGMLKNPLQQLYICHIKWALSRI